jgi:hypothetical protein
MYNVHSYTLYIVRKEGLISCLQRIFYIRRFPRIEGKSPQLFHILQPRQARVIQPSPEILRYLTPVILDFKIPLLSAPPTGMWDVSTLFVQACFHAQILTEIGRKKSSHFACYFGAQSEFFAYLEKCQTPRSWEKFGSLWFRFLKFFFCCSRSGIQIVWTYFEQALSHIHRSSQRLAGKNEDTLHLPLRNT